jgi:hypothetical protein
MLEILCVCVRLAAEAMFWHKFGTNSHFNEPPLLMAQIGRASQKPAERSDALMRTIIPCMEATTSVRPVRLLWPNNSVLQLRLLPLQKGKGGRRFSFKLGAVAVVVCRGGL